jgi:hypothetical protein
VQLDWPVDMAYHPNAQVVHVDAPMAE